MSQLVFFLFLAVTISLTIGSPIINEDVDIVGQDFNAHKATSGSNPNLPVNLLYRHDVVDCTRQVVPPAENSGNSYWAWPHYSYFSGRFGCYTYNLNRNIQYVSEHTRMITIHSRNSSTNSGKYEPYIYQQAKIRCPNNLHAKLDLITSYINLEPRTTIGGQGICLDYVRIKVRNSLCEICGTENISQKCDFTMRPIRNRYPIEILFRSGQDVNEAGFRLNFVCSDTQQQSEKDCLKTSKSLSWKNYKMYYFDDTNFAQMSTEIKLVPKDTMKILFNFYNAHNENLSTASVEYHKDVLALSYIAEKSCDPFIKTAGLEVQKLFPKSEVTRAKQETDSFDYFDNNK